MLFSDFLWVRDVCELQTLFELSKFELQRCGTHMQL
jgi:hypothetical protein